MATIKTLVSEVELNQKLICEGDKLIYCDNSNYQVWIVTELFEGGFEAICEGEVKDYRFNELQIGWEISEATKEHHKINNRIIYTTK
jgi:hypothetical protein